MAATMIGQNRRQDGTNGPGERWRTSADRRRNHTFAGLLIRVLGVRFPRRSPLPLSRFWHHSGNEETVTAWFGSFMKARSGASYHPVCQPLSASWCRAVLCLTTSSYLPVAATSVQSLQVLLAQARLVEEVAQQPLG